MWYFEATSLLQSLNRGDPKIARFPSRQCKYSKLALKNVNNTLTTYSKKIATYFFCDRHICNWQVKKLNSVLVTRNKHKYMYVCIYNIGHI